MSTDASENKALLDEIARLKADNARLKAVILDTVSGYSPHDYGDEWFRIDSLMDDLVGMANLIKTGKI